MKYQHAGILFTIWSSGSFLGLLRCRRLEHLVTRHLLLHHSSPFQALLARETGLRSLKFRTLVHHRNRVEVVPAQVCEAVIDEAMTGFVGADDPDQVDHLGVVRKTPEVFGDLRDLCFAAGSPFGNFATLDRLNSVRVRFDGCGRYG